MRFSNVACKLLVAGVVLACTSSSFATDLLSFTYSDLDGDFTAVSGLFTAVDDANADGEVTRLVAPTGDAFFDGRLIPDGFPGPASFGIAMTVTSILPGTAIVSPGDGIVILSDVNADVFTGLLEGSWLNVGGSANFIGLISGFMPINTSGDGTFDGTDGSSISMTFPVSPPFNGNIITLTFGNWFTDGGGTVTDFSDATTLAVGVVEPEPATFALLLLSGFALTARKRR